MKSGFLRICRETNKDHQKPQPLREDPCIFYLVVNVIFAVTPFKEFRFAV